MMGLMKKKRFFGKYYKFISDSNDVLACIISTANEGDMLQVILESGAHFIEDTKSITVNGDVVAFNVHQDDISIKGSLTLSDYHPLKKKVMGPFTYLPLECKHDIYSMSHRVNGALIINDKEVKFTNALGYIEGDKGKNFPKKYVWYNSLMEGCTVTFAVASIPIGFIRFNGILCFIKTKEQEYYLCTYNGAKLKQVNEKQLIIKKGKYKFILNYDTSSGHNLKAPVKGNMSRYIKESVTTLTSYQLLYKDKIILENVDPTSSLEYMWE